MANLQITQTGSTIGGKFKQRETLRTLGLGKIGRTTVREATPQVRGMIQVVMHLVKVEEVD